MLRVKPDQRSALEIRLVEVNRELALKGSEPLRKTELLHWIITNGLVKVRVKDGKLRF